MINAVLVGDRELMQRFTRYIPDKVRMSLRRKVTSLALKLEAHIKLNKLSGQVLGIITGDLKSSIHSEVRETKDEIIGRVFSANVKYAAIHEFGGTINHPGGQPYMVIAGKGAVFVSKAKAGSKGIAGYTKAHVINMPERSYMRSGMRDLQTQITEGLKDAVREGLAK